MNKLNIKEYKTKGGEVRYILRGAYIGTDVLTGKQVKTYVRGRTKTGVKNELERLKNDFKKNGCAKRKSSLNTFSEVAESFFEFYKLQQKIGSVKQMRANLDTYSLPAFGNKRISKITTAQIQKQVILWAKNAAEPLEGKQKRTQGKGKDYKLQFNVINRIFQHAFSLGMIDFNPCQSVIIPQIKIDKATKQLKFYTKMELETLFSHVRSLPSGKWSTEYFQALLRLLVASGLRIGEAMALSWSDIDLDKQTISISKTTVQRTTIQDTPKTNKSTRQITIDPKANATLKHWFFYQKKHFMSLGNPHQPLVFPTWQGNVMDYHSLAYRLKKIETEAKLPLLSFHGFRHSHASLCLNAGMTYKVIQERLGHSTLQMTMDLYSHLEPEKKNKELELFTKYAKYAKYANF
ncbi:tyrosine-type recombinase/integrase [Lactococcus kimchii]|uniref:tyrosine-type recombinase/integrase n=1 Tax=Lactococcus sp. S-13 TaxID=2507158 RepID=UPI001022A8A9|nr:site-specific integrase [Lactococcus sp. S-13]RZI49021.1 site-specific integrase [Lactococcus sp. S-13]